MPVCPDVVKRLIEHFDQQADQVRSADYNETQLRIDFINPMFAQLGWDMDNAQGFAEQYREVVHEDRIKIAGTTKAPDYSFRVGGVRKFFLEAKKPFVKVGRFPEAAYQLRRYGWSAKLAVSLLTNFEELVIYDCRIRPKHLDKVSAARRELIKYTDYPARWDFLEGTFSKRAVLTGEFDRYCASTKGRGAQEFDKAFLEEIEEWRKKLASNIALRNDLSEHDLNFATQRIIDRIIFLRICEDRGVEPTGHLQQLLNGERTYARLAEQFREADARYNSGLFHFKYEAGREETPDELTLSLEIDDAALKSILRRLYYPESPYEFTVVSADILGSVYERFLGNVIERRGAHGIKIVEKPDVRKAGGVYYTPSYIVDYIVKQTVGKLLEGKTPRDAAELKILDPACGSGSFLLGAYQYLLDWHLKWYVKNGPEKWTKGKSATIRPADKPSLAAPAQNAGSLADPSPVLGHWALTTRERKRMLLDNIHGVDIDYQAVEVTKLSLLLRCLEGETTESIRAFSTLFRERALPDLGHNIQCGNSLIGTELVNSPAWQEMTNQERDHVNPFDYEPRFPNTFGRPNPGFDIILGNPPYVNAWELYETSAHIRDYINNSRAFATAVRHWDLYVLFLERAMNLTRSAGRFSFIIPYSFAIQKYAQAARNLLLRHASLEQVVDLRTLMVFQDVPVITIIPVFSKVPPTEQSKTAVIRPSSPARKGDPVILVESHIVVQQRFLHQQEEMLRLDLSDLAEGLCARIENASIKLGYICLINYGAQMSSRERGRFGKEFVLRHRKESSTCRKTVGGRDLYRYSVSWHGKYVDWGLANLMYGPRHESFFELPKLMIRDITGTHRLELSFDASGLYCDHTILLAQRWLEASSWCSADTEVVETSQSYSYPLLLGVLASRLVSAYYYLKLTGEGVRIGGGFHTYPKTIRQLPVPKLVDLTKAQRTGIQQLEKLAASMLSLHAAEAAAKSPAQKDRLQRQIEATDRQIDQLVYRLYGLTQAEIRLVEDSTADPSAVRQDVERI